jgi:membrane fusion protein, multidrug efflux system
MIKRFVIAFLLLAVVAGGIVGFNLFRDQAIEGFFANRPVPALPVDTEVAEAGPWVPTLEAIGTVNSSRGIELAVEAGGVVREVTFEANDWVEEGEVLVRIADEVEQADLAAAESDVALAEQTLSRVSSLGTRGIAAASSVDEAEAGLASARAQIQRIQALIDQKVLVAPFSGEVGIPLVEEGQFVTVGTAVARLQNVERLRVDFSLPEQNLPQLEIGQPVIVTAETGGTAEGEITGIEPRVDPATRLVAVRAVLDNEDGALSPGQFVRVRVALPAEQNVVALPQTAVVTSLYGDYVYAVVPAEDSTEEEPGFVASQVFVRTGSRQGERVEIATGVEPGDRVVIAGQNRLSNGAPVTVEDADEEPQPAGIADEEGAPGSGAAGPGAAQAAESAR